MPYQTIVLDIDFTKHWDSITTLVLDDGSVGWRKTVHDDGVVRLQSYTAGVLDSVTLTDGDLSGPGARAWSTMTTTYDVSGARLSQTVQFDSGEQRFDSYANGVLSHSLRLDTDTTGGTGARIWDSIETWFDAAGAPALRRTVQDDGIVAVETFTSGIRQDRTRYDIDDVAPWSVRTEHFNADGSLAARTVRLDAPFDFVDASGMVLYPGGDEIVTIYQDGLPTARMEVDHDNSESWFARVDSFDATGTLVDSVLHDSQSGVPALFSDYLPVLELG